ncbi:MAG: hypothetical protein ACTSU6_07620, partial [Candidatus Njordarchaeales archaeon]
MERNKVFTLGLLFVVLGYFSCGFALKNGIDVPAILYWFFFLAIPSISILSISDNENYNMFILLMASISVYSMFFLQSHTWYPAERDSLFEMQITSLICKTGRWNVSMGTAMSPEHSPYPLMHIFVAATSIITGINPYQTMFIIPWIKGIGLILFFYLFAKNYLSDLHTQVTSTFVASMVYLGCVWYLGYP